MLPRPKGISPILGGYYFFYFALVGVYLIFMPKALVELNYNSVEIGIIYAAAPFMRFLLPFIFKHYISLTSKIYTLSLVFTFIATLILIQSVHSFWLYVFANLLFGGAMGISLPYVETIALESLSKKYYGKIRLWGSLGFIFISLSLAQLLSHPHEVFYYLSAMSFFTLIMGVLMLRYDTNTVVSKQEENAFSLRKYWSFWLSLFLMQVGFGGFYNFFTVYESANGISLEVISYLWSFGVLCEIVMLYFQGALLQRNLLMILQVSTFITAIRWFILYLYPDSMMMTFATQSLHAFSFALYHTAAISYIFSLYSQKKLAQQFFLGIAFGLGGSVGAILAGQIYGTSLFLFEAFITLLAFFVLFIHQKQRLKEIK